MSRIITTPLGRFRAVTLAGVHIDDHTGWLWECPGCGALGHLDKEQWNGSVSVDCAGTPPGCKGKYHETHDFGSALRAAIKLN